MRCARCGSLIDRAVASISASVLGDEETETYYLCSDCGSYSLVRTRDGLHAGEQERPSTSLERSEGDERVALIRSCPQPLDKHCRCTAHHEYFGPWLAE